MDFISLKEQGRHMFAQYRKAKKDFKAFKDLPLKKKKYVFYSEGRAYWGHLKPILIALMEDLNEEVVYVTSDLKDPAFEVQSPRLRCYYVGEGFLRTLFFKSLEAQLCIMTSPDLDVYYIKRSIHPVHYVYVFHSLVSTHMVYRKKAFYHYDTVLYPGPYHKQELEEAETRYQLPKKQLLPHGYGRLDEILRKKIKPCADKTILVAPSWGKNTLLDIADKVIDTLIQDFKVILRPHPQSFRQAPKQIQAWIKQFKDHPNFTLDDDFNGTDSLDASQVLITDWSGVAYDYAFGYLKPVLFVDVPKKINNPDYEALGIVPFEESIRKEVGDIVGIHELHRIPAMIASFLREKDTWPEKLKHIRQAKVCHLGDSGLVGAKHLAELHRNLFESTVPKAKTALVT